MLLQEVDFGAFHTSKTIRHRRVTFKSPGIHFRLKHLMSFLAALACLIFLSTNSIENFWDTIVAMGISFPNISEALYRLLRNRLQDE